MKRKIMIVVSFIASLGLASAAFAAGSGGGGGGGGSTASSTGTRSAPQQLTAIDVYNQGYALWNQGKYSAAAPYFQQAISMKGDYAEAYNMLGFCTRKMGDLTKAIGYYETALKLKPNVPEAREYFGEAYLEMGDLTRAVQQYVWLEGPQQECQRAAGQDLRLRERQGGEQLSSPGWGRPKGRLRSDRPRSGGAAFFASPRVVGELQAERHLLRRDPLQAFHPAA
jgi:tetratricopeptide (TPR) repeat protein